MTFTVDGDHDLLTIVAQLRHDRGPITARSWPDHGAIVVLFGSEMEAEL